MGVNTQLTPVQWGALIAMILIALFPFVVAPMAGGGGSFALGLPMWFWLISGIGVVMYALVVVFIRNIGGKSVGESDAAAEVS